MNASSPSSALPSVELAVRAVLLHAQPLASETVPLAAAFGRVAAHDVVATSDLPQGDVSTMDGYALRSADLRAPDPVFTVVGESAAGHRSTVPLLPGHAIRISTGAWLPADADLVVPQEDTTRDGSQIRVDLAKFGPVRPGRWVRHRGSDVQAGAVVVRGGVCLGPTDLACIAAAGHVSAVVHRRPRVALLSTGDELVPIGQTPQPGQIVNTNALMLQLLLEQAGADVVSLGIARDDAEAIRRRLESAPPCDVWVTSGGVSVGDHDHMPAVLHELGWTFDFHGVALRPGKPTAFARRGQQFAFGLPGNPASSFVAFWLFLRPLLRRLAALGGNPEAPRIPVRLRTPVEGAGRRAHYVRAQLHDDGTATALPTQVSGDLTSMVDVDALLVVPPGVDQVPAGTVVDAIVVEPWWRERRPRTIR